MMSARLTLVLAAAMLSTALPAMSQTLEGALSRSAAISKQANASGRQLIAALQRTEPLVPKAVPGPKTLSCTRADGKPGVWNIRINYGVNANVVQLLSLTGRTVWISGSVDVSELAYTWSIDYMDRAVAPPMKAHWEGYIDRNSGTGTLQDYRYGPAPYERQSVICHEVKTPIL